MKRYSRAELVAFLRRVDALLTKREVLEVVGGAAAVLKYGASAPTRDIDTWNRVPKAVQDAVDAVGAMGQGVPLAPAGVRALGLPRAAIVKALKARTSRSGGRRAA